MNEDTRAASTLAIAWIFNGRRDLCGTADYPQVIRPTAETTSKHFVILLFRKVRERYHTPHRPTAPQT